MDISPDALKGKSKREIVRELVEEVVTSEDEFEEKETRSGDRTDLNLYLADNQGFEIGELDSWVTFLGTNNRITGHAQNYVKEHTFSEEPIEEDISFVTITTPAKGREDEFIFVLNDGYLWVLTTVHSDWREKTIENFLKYLPCVERLYLSSEDLEDLVRDIQDSRISGFTAKYHTPHRERDATLQFDGAEPGDLETAEEAFDATPTRIEFDQTNSPTTAIQGANTNKGRITLRSVVDGSEPKAVETLLGLSTEYQEIDHQSFDVHRPPKRDVFDSGFTIEGFTAIELFEPDREEAADLGGDLQSDVLNKNRYRFGIRDDGNKIRVYDQEYDEIFDIALEPPDIILYPRESTTALSLRSFVREVYDEMDSTYSLRKVESPVAQ